MTYSTSVWKIIYAGDEHCAEKYYAAVSAEEAIRKFRLEFSDKWRINHVDKVLSCVVL